MELLLQQMGAAASLCLWARMPAHMKAYAFVFAKTHGANRRRTSVKAKISTSPSPAELVRHSSEILPSAPQIFPCPLALFPSFSHFLPFLPSLLTNQLNF
jgi:hypothetical protein